MPGCDLAAVTADLESRGLEYVVTPLEPIDGTRGDGQENLEAHVVQYYTKGGEDVVALVVGDNVKVVNMNGRFNNPITADLVPARPTLTEHTRRRIERGERA